MIMFTFTDVTRVINELDGLTTITTCQGWQVVYTCELNSNIRSDDVQWYRFIKDTSTTVMVDPNGANINVNTSGDTILTVANAQKSYDGYYWVAVGSEIFCNASFTTTTSMYVCMRIKFYHTITVCTFIIHMYV